MGGMGGMGGLYSTYAMRPPESTIIFLKRGFEILCRGFEIHIKSGVWSHQMEGIQFL
jgi:hypothetical protein